MQVDFERLTFALDAPRSVVPSNYASQGDRASALLAWVASPNGCGMEQLLNSLGAIAPLPSILNPSQLDTPVVIPERSPIASGVGGVQIFLAHAKEDEAQVMELYERLRSRGDRPWMDKKDLLPGQNWRKEIRRAIRTSELFIACLSHTSVLKRGYVQREFQFALEEQQLRPSHHIYLIPLRLDMCEPPDIRLAEYGESLRDYKWVDYFKSDGFDDLEKSIEKQIELIKGPDYKPPEKRKDPFFPFLRRPKPKKTVLTINQSTFEVSEIPTLRKFLNRLTRFFEFMSGSTEKWSSEKNLVHPPYRLDVSSLQSDEISNAGLTVLFNTASINIETRAVEVQRGSVEFLRNDLGNNIFLDLVKIPSGSFIMGASSSMRTSRPQHEVTLQSFWMGRYPVTQAQYEAVMGPDSLPRFWLTDVAFPGKPVVRVTWDDAIAFCQKLSDQTGQEYRLPSEAEWEYACRAGQNSFAIVNYGGTDYPNKEIKKDEYRGEIMPVGHFLLSNAFGLHYMHGCIREWCQDFWHDNYEGAPSDGIAWEEPPSQFNQRVIRGLSYDSYSREEQLIWRSSGNSEYDSYGDVGFRVVLAPR